MIVLHRRQQTCLNPRFIYELSVSALARVSRLPYCARHSKETAMLKRFALLCRIHDPPRRGRRTSGSCANPFLTANRPVAPSTKRLSFTEHRALDTSGKTATTHGMAAKHCWVPGSWIPRPTDTTGPRLSGHTRERGKAGIAIRDLDPYRNRNGRRDDRWNRDRDESP